MSKDTGLSERMLVSGRRGLPVGPSLPLGAVHWNVVPPRAVIEGLRIRPSWFPAAILGARFDTLAWNAHYISWVLPEVRGQPDPPGYLVDHVLGDLGSEDLWTAAIAPFSAIHHVLYILVLAAVTTALARQVRLGVEFRCIRSVVS